MTTTVLLLLGTLASIAALFLLFAGRRRGRVRARLFAGEVESTGASESRPVTSAESGPLARALIRAGHRRAGAATAFLVVSSLFAAAGFGAMLALRASELGERVAIVFDGLPVLGPGLGLVGRSVPFLVGLAIAVLPWISLRRTRARRAAQIDAALPLVVELLAALVEAGLGFESALAEVLSAHPKNSPLAEELRLFQVEVAAGSRRRDALERLAWRCDRPDLTSFVVAWIHAGETGAGLVGTLRPQAREARRARRERALARAESLPEKLVLPLLLGFLPSLLVWTLGPAFFQLFSMLDAALG